MEKTLKLTVTKTERNYGIDLLRIVSMMMIVTLHVLGRGGILETVSNNSVKFVTVWFLEVMCLCSVNCYGLISGYVGYGRKFKFANIINLWIEVVFYNVLINVLFFILYKMNCFTTFEGKFSTMFFPLTNENYWYFTAYFFMSFFIPLFNFMLQRLPKKKITYILLATIGMYSVFYVYFFNGNQDVFLLGRGYGIVWLSILYLIGAYIKKYNFFKNIKVYKCILIFLFNSALLLVCKFLEVNEILVSWFRYSIMDYNNFLHLVNGIVLLALFSKLGMNKIMTSITKFFAPATFGVYIIHLHLCIWFLLKQRFKIYAQYPIPLMIGAIILTVLGIWLICSLIDRIRILLFDLLKVKKYCIKLENLGRKIFDKVYDKYFVDTVE